MNDVTCFIGSSNERLNVARALADSLESTCLPIVWQHDVFDLSSYPLESLVAEFSKSDFFCFIISPDDLTVSRGKEDNSPRDNVVLEIGMAIGSSNRNRVFLVAEEPISNIKLPSDLKSLNIASYKYENFSVNELAALNSASRKIRNKIQLIGPKRNSDTVYSTRHLLREVSNAFVQPVDIIVGKLANNIREKGVIRYDWNIITRIDNSKEQEGIIEEILTWSYSLRNVLIKDIDYTFNFFDYSDSAFGVSYTVSKDAPAGEILLDSENQNADKGLRKRTTQIPIRQGEAVRFVVNYLIRHWVNPNKVLFHNSFVTTNPTESTIMTVDLPEGYDIDVLGEDLQESHQMNNRRVFRLTGPILPESCVEYIVRKL